MVREAVAIGRRSRLFILALFLLAPACRCPEPATFAGGVRDERGYLIVYGDSRHRLALEFWRPSYDREREAVIARLAEESPDLLLHTGDLVTWGSHCSAWGRFDRDHEPLVARKVPFWPLPGNHEYWGSDEQGLANYFARFPHLFGRKWYELRYRGLLLLMLDSNETSLAAWERTAQGLWLEDQLARAARDPVVRHVLLLTHHPPYTNSRVHRPSRFVQETFLARARACPKARAIFSGHVHSYERFLEHGVHCVVSGGGGAPLTPVAGKKGRFKDHFDGPDLRRFNYCRVTVEKQRVSVAVMMLDEAGRWSLADRFVIPG